jgi:RHH-type proline utilization regulon transcriptional repressor/proline dehydrogenase/delta 1-pyrroline-5-carboxylate dehydrogenase
VQYDRFAGSEILESHDHCKLIGQDNLRKYLPVRQLRIRISETDTSLNIIARMIAAVAVGCRVTVSYSSQHDRELLHWLEVLAEAILAKQTDRVRYSSPEKVPLTIRQAALDAHIHLADRPVSAAARVELLWYVQEQSISRDYHRYGNLGMRAEEKRTEPN